MQPSEGVAPPQGECPPVTIATTMDALSSPIRRSIVGAIVSGGHSPCHVVLPISFASRFIEGKVEPMPAKPTIEQLRAIANDYGMHMTNEDLTSFVGLMSAALESYRRIDQLTEPALPVRHPRLGGYRPAAAENPL